MLKRILRLAALVAGFAIGLLGGAPGLIRDAAATLNAPGNTVTYSGNGSTTAFATTFPFLQRSDLVVTVAGITKTLNTDFTVSGAGNATGTVTFTTAPANGAAVIITRTVDYLQKTSLKTNRNYDPANVEAALDKLAMGEQQLAAQVAAPVLPSALINATPITANNTTTSRQLQEWFGDTFNAKAFNAKCDNATNDSGAIQAALSQAAALGGTVVLPAGNCLLGSTGLTLLTTPKPVRIQGAGAGATTLLYSGTGNALTIGQAAGPDIGNVTLDGFGIDLGSAGSGAGALKTVRVTGGVVQSLQITGRVTLPDLGTGILLDGTGNYSGSIAFNRVVVTGNYTIGIDCLGAAGINTCNHHTFTDTTVARTTAKPGTGTIGFRWGVNAGDGVLVGPDVEGYDTAYQINGRFLHGFLRCENNTVCVAFGATAFNNFLYVQPFGNTTLATYAGGNAFNSLIDTIQLQMNMAIGQVTYNHNTDSAMFFDYQAGAAADQLILMRFLDRLGNIQGRLWKSSFNFITLDDGATPRLNFAGGSPANDSTLIGSAGTGQIGLNKSTGTGTGGTCFGDGAGNCKATVDSAGRVAPGTFTNATLGTPANGVTVYCSDCTIANPCAGAGTGAMAKRLNGVWVCN